jgi:chromosome segregation ATPase
MTNKNDSESTAVDITELPTGEYPAVTEPQAAGERGASDTRRKESHKAAFWLTHLETEVNRLHAKWHSINAEFKSREAKIAQLNDELQARDKAIERLAADLQQETAALKAADERLDGKDAEIAALTDDRRALDGKIAALAAELANAEAAHKAALEAVKRAETDAARLNDVIRQEQAAAARIAERNEELLADEGRLQSKLQDLETYINGRHERWSQLNTQLDEHKDALVGMEKTIKARDAALARHEEEKARLAARILDLERQCAELAGRRKEREEAFDELQQKLAAHFVQIEQFKAEQLEQAKEVELAAKKAVDAQRHIESLERGITRRDESIQALNTEVEQAKAAVEELTSAKTKLARRVEELDKGVAERSQQVQVLREDLRMSHDQLRLAQDQLSERTMQLAATQENLDQKSRHIERLTHELDAANQDAEQLRADLAKLGAHASELDESRSKAAAEVDNLKLELAAQQELVTSLESELRAKQAAADLLERNVDRITDLGASLAALDDRMNTDDMPADDDGPSVDASISQLKQIVATMAAPPAEERPAVEGNETMLLPVDILLDDDDDVDDDDVVDVGERTGIDAARKLVIMIDGEAFDYPIVKRTMTIGRGHGSDIRIASHFVSRLHATVSTSGIATIIEDAGSKNGILVNSERVQRRVLRHGDVVSLGGELNLRFVDATH